jgi:hypothetical protein
MFIKRENGEIVATAKRQQQFWPVEKLADDDAEVMAFINPPEPEIQDAVETAILGDPTLNAIYLATADALGVTDADFMASIKTFAGETGATGP